MTKVEFKAKFVEMVQAAERVVITTHIRPDGDAISSALSMQMYLQSHLGLKSDVVITGAQTDIWDKWDTEGVIQWVSDALKVCAEADLIIALDGAEYKRFGYDPDKLAKSTAKKICIDHHPDEPDQFDLIWKDVTATAAAQLIYELLYEDEKTSPSEAEMLVRGIFGDTAVLRYISPQKSRVLEVVKNLIEIGNIDVQLMAGELDHMSEVEFEIIKECVKNTRNVEPDGIPQLTYSFLEHDFCSLYDPEVLKGGTSSFLVQFVRKIDDHGWGFVVRATTEKEFNISFRALPGTVDCQRIAQEFNGGGHKLAAGGEYVTDEKMSAEEVCKLVIERIKEIKDEIIAK